MPTQIPRSDRPETETRNDQSRFRLQEICDKNLAILGHFVVIGSQAINFFYWFSTLTEKSTFKKNFYLDTILTELRSWENIG